MQATELMEEVETTTAPVEIPKTVKAINLVMVIVPFLGLIGAIAYFWGWGVSWLDVSLLVGLYMVTFLGITAGFHRLFTHRAFKTYPAIQVLFAVAGSMAIQGSLMKWVALHRRHHQFSDQEHDPHSPHLHGDGVLGAIAGFWHSHIGWFFQPDPPSLQQYVKDLNQSKPLRIVSALFPLWVFVSLILPAVLGGLISMSWSGAFLGFLWGGLVRIFFVHHITWCINSVCHIWGGQPYQNRDQSRNNLIFGLLALGEGWHNNHHAMPTSARHGLRWWQIDISYWVIWTLARCHLAWNVSLPTERE